MRTVAIIQARMGSTRLPGKSGRLLLGKPQIWHVLNRVKRVNYIDDIMLAIPHESSGGVLKEAAQDLNVPVLDFHGNPDDLVHRYALAADIMNANIVVRIPGDNTFVDPDEVDRILQAYADIPSAWDILTSNLDRDIHDNGYPAGLGAEVYDVRYFYALDRFKLQPRLREHPHLWAFEHDSVRTITAPEHVRNPGMKFSVDTEDDWKFTEEIYSALYPDNPDFRIRDIMKFLGEKNV